MLNQLLLILAISLFINIAMFLVAYKYKTDKLTDISYALTFIVLAFVSFLSGSGDTSSKLIVAMVTIWAVRLGGFLLIRIWKTGKDARFDEMRNSFSKFGRFWLLQAVTVWVVMLAANLALLQNTSNRDIVLLSWVGLLIWLAGLVIESIADNTKRNFSLNPKNKGKWIDEGIWKYSRHPNYFGEILVWAGMFILVAPLLSGTELLVVFISPLFITTLLCFVSGIPLLEKSADKKWGNLKDYQEYKRRTSILALIPKKKA